VNLEYAQNLPSICARWQLALTLIRAPARDRNRTSTRIPIRGIRLIRGYVLHDEGRA
jgi:hypothetical protein